MIPVGKKDNLSNDKVIEIINKIEPRIIIPMDFKIPGIKENIDSIDKFVKAMGITNQTPIDKLKIEKLHIKWEDIDLHVKIWSDRCRRAWSGCNIPSFEIFTSPDKREINWRVKFNQPLYRYWSLIKWIELEFKDWFVTKASAIV